jgi:hypothetical protein
MIVSAFCSAALQLFVVPIAARGQAAVEYAIKSAGGAVAGSGGSAVAGCRVDSSLLSCLGRSYPRTMAVVAVVVCLLLVRWLATCGRYGTR